MVQARHVALGKVMTAGGFETDSPPTAKIEPMERIANALERAAVALQMLSSSNAEAQGFAMLLGESMFPLIQDLVAKKHAEILAEKEESGPEIVDLEPTH